MKPSLCSSLLDCYVYQ